MCRGSRNPPSVLDSPGGDGQQPDLSVQAGNFRNPKELS